MVQSSRNKPPEAGVDNSEDASEEEYSSCEEVETERERQKRIDQGRAEI